MLTGLAENVEIDILYKSKGQKRKRMKRSMRNYGGVRNGSACSDRSIKNRTLGDSKKFTPSSSVTERLCDCYSLETPFALLQVEKGGLSPASSRKTEGRGFQMINSLY